ncbi:MAG: hypothetical protein CM15mP81_06010 [Alphaproteobacteria bacterium]|nr:MAG: hypothetical protein CM15mP81_06010 [Alphaproteobacteria bacterium]
MGALIVQEMLLKYPKLCKFGIAMGTSGAKSGYIHEWEEAEINLRNSGIKMPSDFALIHYAFLFPFSKVLGKINFGEKVCLFFGVYSDRNSEMLSAQWQACLEYSALKKLP